MKKRILSLLLALVLLSSLSVSAFAAAPAAAPHFTDVPTTHWAYANIERAYSDGVMAGNGGEPGQKNSLAATRQNTRAFSLPAER